MSVRIHHDKKRDKKLWLAVRKIGGKQVSRYFPYTDSGEADAIEADKGLAAKQKAARVELGGRYSFRKKEFPTGVTGVSLIPFHAKNGGDGVPIFRVGITTATGYHQAGYGLQRNTYTGAWRLVCKKLRDVGFLADDDPDPDPPPYKRAINYLRRKGVSERKIARIAES